MAARRRPPDGQVLAVQVGLAPFLDGAGDLAHALIALRLGEDPAMDDDAVADGHERRRATRHVVSAGPEKQEIPHRVGTNPCALGQPGE
jgi:hypothetical protein